MKLCAGYQPISARSCTSRRAATADGRAPSILYRFASRRRTDRALRLSRLSRGERQALALRDNAPFSGCCRRSPSPSSCRGRGSSPPPISSRRRISPDWSPIALGSPAGSAPGSFPGWWSCHWRPRSPPTGGSSPGRRALPGLASIILAAVQWLGYVPPPAEPMTLHRCCLPLSAPERDGLCRGLGDDGPVSFIGARRMRQARAKSATALLAENATDMITRHDEKGRVIFASLAAQQLFGEPVQKIAGDGLFERVHVADRPAYLTALSRSLADNEPIAVEFRVRSDERQPKRRAMSGSRCVAGRCGFGEGGRTCRDRCHHARHLRSQGAGGRADLAPATRPKAQAAPRRSSSPI